MLRVQASGPFMLTVDLIGPDGIPNVELPICPSGTGQFIVLVRSGPVSLVCGRPTVT